MLRVKDLLLAVYPRLDLLVHDERGELLLQVMGLRAKGVSLRPRERTPHEASVKFEARRGKEKKKSGKY